jgi:hypothetical protein
MVLKKPSWDQIWLCWPNTASHSGYVASQFKKLQTDLRNQGQIKWKHAMHLIRLLISGIDILRNQRVAVDVGEHRDELLAIRPDYLKANELLIQARRSALSD